MTRDAFDEIYRRNLWSGRETRSGPGSSSAATRRLAEWVVDLCDREIFDVVETVVDVPCGEGHWFPELPARSYVGIDVVPAAVEAARQLHPDRPYFVADARTHRLPDCDLVFSRDFMQHLPIGDGVLFLDNVRRCDPTFLLASSYTDGDNARGPQSAYHAYRVNLEVEPFGLGPPNEFIEDGYGEDGTLLDEGKIMGLWRL